MGDPMTPDAGRVSMLEIGGLLIELGGDPLTRAKAHSLLQRLSLEREADQRALTIQAETIRQLTEDRDVYKSLWEDEKEVYARAVEIENELRETIRRLEGEVAAKQIWIDQYAQQTERALQQRDEAWAEFDDLKQRAEAAEGLVNRLTNSLKEKGYHAPGDCQHGMAHWRGDHCAYDWPALTPTSPAAGAEGA